MCTDKARSPLDFFRGLLSLYWSMFGTAVGGVSQGILPGEQRDSIPLRDFISRTPKRLQGFEPPCEFVSVSQPRIGDPAGTRWEISFSCWIA